MAEFRTSRVFDVIFVVIVAAGVWWAAANRVAIGDWWFFLHYHPSAAVTALANDAGMNATGRHLFYRTDPQLADTDTINQVCGEHYLGCLTPRGQVYILNDASQHNRSIVTAAHEMLHMAYRRLSGPQKSDLQPLLGQAIAQNGASNLPNELSGASDSDDRDDEAHSLLGSEYQFLPTALEDHYRQFFSDRSKSVTAQAHSAQAN